VNRDQDTAAARPYARMDAALRRDIAYGHIPPGGHVDHYEYASRYGVGHSAAYKVSKALEDDGLLHEYLYHCYATPAGPPDPAVAARLGATLALLRETARRDPGDLATGRWDARDVTDAENGTWRPRSFWAAMDTALGSDGTLLKVHDNYYAGPVPDAPDPGPPPPPFAVGQAIDQAAQIAGLITASLAAGEWAPGTVLPTQHNLADRYATQPVIISLALRKLASQGSLIPLPIDKHGRQLKFITPVPGHPAAAPPLPPECAPALTAVILLWSDGTRTHLPLPASDEKPERTEDQA
jgi:ribosomal protein S25